MSQVEKIRVLDDGTVDRIAAGEVVERPSSVVKELVENALDAGADAIAVAVDDGGRKRVAVLDNGCGMSEEDAKLCFSRHATSKIRGIDDLRELNTYGFRGEALSSVSSVARVTLRTREHGASGGVEVVFEGGVLVSSSSVGCPVGTEVIVEDLFYNTPARRKQMKSTAIERSYCREVVTDFVLCRPAISFKLSADGELLFAHAKAEGMDGALVLAFGHDVAGNMLSGQSEGEGVRVESHVSRLEHTVSSPADLRLFVNHRPVKSRAMLSTIASTFGSRIMKDRYPMGVVKVHVDASTVDVNVHPTKREVRFDDDRPVLDAVKRSLLDALEGPDLSYRYDLTHFSEKFAPTAPPRILTRASASQSVLSLDDREAEGDDQSIRPLAQILDTYILADSGDNLVLIDQHAASERIAYERLLQHVEGEREASQELLSPLVVSLTPTEARVLEENRERLAEVGFDLEPFGGGSYALRSMPTVLGAAQGERSLRDILADLADMSVPKRMGLEFIWRVACHTSIRAGQKLSHQQMRQLLSELMSAESPYTCEHGRPTMVVLSPTDLEKLFKRRV